MSQADFKRVHRRDGFCFVRVMNRLTVVELHCSDVPEGSGRYDRPLGLCQAPH